MMKKSRLLLKSFCVSFFLLASIKAMGQLNTEGFYKDAFIDAGAGLDQISRYYAADNLGLSYDFIKSTDQKLLRSLVDKNASDENGVLLYPDGSPRFRVIYVNGGLAATHGNALGVGGLNNYRKFYRNGGSYTGSCAGAFMASIGTNLSGNSSYLQIWPGFTKTIDIPTAPMYYGAIIEPNSPLLKYSNFGGDNYINPIETWYGPYANYENNMDVTKWPIGTEILLRYDSAGRFHHMKPSAWSYKQDMNTGRIVVIGNHPEYQSTGDGLDLMKAIFQYAFDGSGKPKLKGTINNTQVWMMNDNAILNHEKIGDRQYHHFKIQLESDVSNLSIELNSSSSYTLNLYVRQNDFAFKSNANWKMIAPGSSKVLNLGPLSAGTYYISVENASSVISRKMSWGYSYTGNLSILNGVPYSIKASWQPL
jgi:hypothetical protein